jgi:hypothetical protein
MLGLHSHNSFIYIGLHEFKEVRRGAPKGNEKRASRARSHGLVAPQGFEPSEQKQDTTNLVEDAHMDAHTRNLAFIASIPAHFFGFLGIASDNRIPY